MKNMYAVSIRLVESLKERISEISYSTALAAKEISNIQTCPQMFWKTSLTWINLLDPRQEKAQSIYLMGLKFEAISKELAEHFFLGGPYKLETPEV